MSSACTWQMGPMRGICSPRLASRHPPVAGHGRPLMCGQRAPCLREGLRLQRDDCLPSSCGSRGRRAAQRHAGGDGGGDGALQQGRVCAAGYHADEVLQLRAQVCPARPAGCSRGEGEWVVSDITVERLHEASCIRISCAREQIPQATVCCMFSDMKDPPAGVVTQW